MMMYSLPIIYDMPCIPSPTHQQYMNVAYKIAWHVINSSNVYDYPSYLLSLHVNTFRGMFVVC